MDPVKNAWLLIVFAIIVAFMGGALNKHWRPSDDNDGLNLSVSLALVFAVMAFGALTYFKISLDTKPGKDKRIGQLIKDAMRKVDQEKRP